MEAEIEESGLDPLFTLQEGFVNPDMVTVHLAELDILGVDVVARRSPCLTAGVHGDVRPVGGAAAVGAEAGCLEASEGAGPADAVADAAGGAGGVGAVGVAGGDALCSEGAEREDDGDGGEGEGCCLEVDEVSPFKRGKDDCGVLVRNSRGWGGETCLG